MVTNHYPQEVGWPNASTQDACMSVALLSALVYLVFPVGQILHINIHLFTKIHYSKKKGLEHIIVISS